MWEAFSFEDKSIDELIEISSLVDVERSSPGFLSNDKRESAQVASVIVALAREKSTAELGDKLYADINELIVQQNFLQANASDGKKLYEKLRRKQGLGKYTIQRFSQGYKFTLKASSGEILAVSEAYSKLGSCLNGIEAVRRNSGSEIDDCTQENKNRVSNPKFELFIDATGEYRFRLKSRNGEVIATSEGYKRKESCLNAIKSVKKHAVSEYIEKA